MPSKDDKIGALWIKEKNGKVYMTGEINGQKVVLFMNGYKEQEKHPDWIAYKSQPRPS